MADPADLEPPAARLEQSGEYRVLRRVPVLTRYAGDDPAAIKRLGLIVDIETTGLDPARDNIIELACRPFHFSSDGVLYDVPPGYAGFEDPVAKLWTGVSNWHATRYCRLPCGAPVSLRP
jgi:DNA polymerase-3 subunit epsilon